jgi:hypothetical protein
MNQIKWKGELKKSLFIFNSCPNQTIAGKNFDFDELFHIEDVT